MKKTLSLISLVVATGAMAQMEIRPHLGVNLQDLTETPAFSEWKSKAGVQLGADLMFGSQLYFAVGAQYVHSAVVITTTYEVPNENDVTVEGTVTTGSLRVPLRVGYRFTDPEDEPVLNFRLFGGLAPSFPIITEFDQDGLQDIRFGSTQLALTAGLGLDISVFFLEAGYDLGLTSFFDDDRIDVDPKANMLQINAGLRLKLAR